MSSLSSHLSCQRLAFIFAYGLRQVYPGASRRHHLLYCGVLSPGLGAQVGGQQGSWKGWSVVASQVKSFLFLCGSLFGSLCLKTLAVCLMLGLSYSACDTGAESIVGQGRSVWSIIASVPILLKEQFSIILKCLCDCIWLSCSPSLKLSVSIWNMASVVSAS